MNIIKLIIGPLIRKPALLIKKRYPKWQANRLYKRHFHRKIDWKNPREFNEKIRWLQFNTDTSKWSQLADKYRVRDYLEKKGYGNLLVKLYSACDNAENMDFTKLPNSFVIKTNHGCGSVYIIKDKQTANLEQLREQLKMDLNKRFGIETAEPHYLRISPIIIIEELLQQDGDFSSSLVDYKFYCINGIPLFCGVMYNRSIYDHAYDVKLYDQNWKDISHLIGNYSKVNIGKTTIPKPRNFELMKDFCKTLCAEFPFVRIDFYECNGKLYFGEFTFTPAACSGRPLGYEACRILSDKIKLPKNTDQENQS